MKKIFSNLLKKDKKALSLMAIAVATLLLLLIGATYAYFAANLGGGTGADLNVATGTTDSLSFSVGKDINLHVTMDDFLEGMESPHGETTATATLKANSVTNQATGRYNVFFIIDNNDFEYSTEEGQTELLLKVTDPNGNEVMDITGLKRVEGGFDITTRTGGFLIMADYDIEATPAETLKSQTWKLEVTFVNLDSDQNVNKGKALNGRFYITTEKESTYELAEINNIEAESSYNSITASLTSLSGTAEIEKYYYAIEEDTTGIAYLGAGVSVARLSNKLAINDTDYIESNEMTHVFDNLKPSTTYKVYSYAIDKNGIKSNVYETEVTTADYFIPIIESVTTSNTTTSITVNANSKRGSEDISKYYYSIDEGDFIESDDASHTFNDLSENTNHTIKVKAKDSNGIESEIYTLTAKTVTLASITNVTTSVTASSVTVNVTAKKGDANIASYYYSKDNGVTWSEATANSSYTFNNLTSNTTYQIKVKVVDTEGRESSEAVATAKTSYVLASITNVTHSTTLNSITVNVTASVGSNSIIKYYYSKDNGSTYEESDSSSHTFNSLLDSTEYKIKIKVKDSDGQYSTEYYEAISTVTYNNPSVTTVASTKTYNSISLTTTAAGGTNSVANYYYKVGTGAWSEAQTTNTYTITGLSENTKYTIKVKVEDTNGRMSNEYTLDVTTNTYIVPTISDVTVKITYNSIELTVTAANGDGTIANYYYSKDNGSTWSTAQTSNIYKFNNLTYNVKFYLKVKVVDNNGRESSEYALTAITEAPVMATYIKNLYTSQGSNGLYYHTSSLANGAGDNSYRYAGADPDNYVCFGVTSFPCPTDNLYRIIGVFGDQVKLIKYDYATSALLGENGAYFDDYDYDVPTYKGELAKIPRFNWNTSSGTSSTNDWAASDLNKINLNTNFLNNIPNSWAEKIATTTWNIGGISNANGIYSNARTAYNYEQGANKINTTYSSKIGISYISEYYYAALPKYWTLPAYTSESNPDSSGNYGVDYDYRSTKANNENWMYHGYIDHTITKSLDANTQIYAIYSAGNINFSNRPYESTYGIRPTFNLTKNTLLKSGNGTKSNPYRIEVDEITPKILDVTASPSSSAIFLNISTEYGSNPIKSYSVSKDGGYTWETVENNNRNVTYALLNLNKSTTYQIRIKISDINDKTSNIYSISSTTTSNTLPTLTTKIKSLYTSQGSNGIYYHNTSLANSAGDNSYRYSGANPNNYICFGSTSPICTEDNLYRIIGVFGEQVKLIKYREATTSLLGTNGDYKEKNKYYWNNKNGESSINKWNESRLNTINLNTNFLNNIGNTWSSKIATSTWYVGGLGAGKTGYNYPANVVYDYELGANRLKDGESYTWSEWSYETSSAVQFSQVASNTVYNNAKIGLMYISEYGFATTPENWTSTLYNYKDFEVRKNNWMYSGKQEWFITRRSTSTHIAYMVAAAGFVQADGNNGTDVYKSAYIVKPTFSLLSNVIFVGGTGTQSDPYRIS